MFDDIVLGGPAREDQPLHITTAQAGAVIGAGTIGALALYLSKGDPTGFAAPIFWTLVFATMSRQKAYYDEVDRREDEARQGSRKDP